jgi:hypothetical protein
MFDHNEFFEKQKIKQVVNLIDFNNYFLLLIKNTSISLSEENYYVMNNENEIIEDLKIGRKS